jgi:two-component system C4-dicarboxylate transport sensor histidine kinase DctB
VQAEAVRLEQVLVNLMANALDAGQNGVEIELAIRLYGGFVELRVANNGPGLSAETRASLFQPFSTTKRDGLGLGLVISRDIMADFGGELVAASPAQGAAFILRLRPAP